MVKSVSFFENIQTRAWAEAALIVKDQDEEMYITPRDIVSKMSDQASAFVLQLACGPDEKPSDTFMEVLLQRNILANHRQTGKLCLGGSGMYLIDRFLEEWEYI